MSRIKRKQKGLLNQKQEKVGNPFAKWVTQGLVFSVALNIALLTSLVFNVVRAKDSGSTRSKSKASHMMSHLGESSSLQNVLIEYIDKSYPELITSLGLETHIEDGFKIKDLALSVLHHQFDFDLERALLGQNFDVRNLPIQKNEGEIYEYPLISGLTEGQYKLIDTFIQNEKWPLTSFGLFKKLAQGLSDESLKNAFYLSKEFMYVDALFCSLSISKEVLLDIILHGNWETFEQFTQEHNSVQKFSNPLRIHFLSNYLEFGSGLAAKLILEIDAEYALRKLTDTQIVALLGHMDQKTNLAENFALHLAVGNRSDWVRKEACRLLYYYADKNLPEPYHYHDSLNFITQKYQIYPIETFTPAAAEMPEGKDFVSITEPHKIYVVQEGDNLWKIAKKHAVHLDQLKEVNQLDSDLIKVGMTLVIP